MNATDPIPGVWNDRLLQNPHAVADKHARVRRMFAAIAPSYDLNNRLHSLGMDQCWRQKAVALADLKSDDHVVDVACGTGDLTLKFARRLRLLKGEATIAPAQVIGVDFTFEMLPLARRKTGGGLVGKTIKGAPLWVNGDAMHLPLPDQCADVVSIAFGIRNVAQPPRAIDEFYRILRPGGRLVILEFSLPTNPLL